MPDPHTSRLKEELGLDRPITRRSFLNGVALTAGGAVLAKSGVGTLAYSGTSEGGGGYDDALIATAHNGRFVGLKKEGVIGFRGIPFAKPPVGDLRWHEPVPCDPSDKLVEAYEYGLASIQPWWHTEEASSCRQGEDCLTLNVWTTDLEPAEKKGVLVWIHGGGYGWGGTVDPLYDGHNFVKRRGDVVLVSVNYRLGLLGFTDLSRFGPEFKNSPNLAVLDHVAALQWVHDNIAAFGGDPDNVTIWGESAGGASVCLLMVMEKAKGLFHKGIVESGSMGYPLTQAPFSEGSKMVTELVLNSQGLPRYEVAKVSTIADLLALPENDMFNLANEITEEDIFDSPTRDGDVIPGDPWQVFIDGAASAKVPLMIGDTSDEDKYNILEARGYTEAGYTGATQQDCYDLFAEWTLWGWKETWARLTAEERIIAKEFFKRRRGLSKVEKITAFNTASSSLLASTKMSEFHSGHGAPTYLYYWTIPSAIERVGACHAVDLAYVFNNLDETIFTGEPVDPTLAGYAVDAWANFVVRGDPSTAAAEWPAYDAERRSTMVFSTEGPHAVDDPLREDRVLLEPLFHYMRNYERL